MTTTNPVKPTISIDQIVRVYSGRPGCACGCRGNYREDLASFKRSLAKYSGATAVQTDEGDLDLDGNKFVYWRNDQGTRTYTIYYRYNT